MSATDACQDCGHPRHAHSREVGQGISRRVECRATVYVEREKRIHVVPGFDAWPCPCTRFAALPEPKEEK